MFLKPKSYCIFLSFVCLLLLFPTGSILHAQGVKLNDERYFKRGEKLVFRVAFHSLMTGNITAGSASLEITKENKNMSGKNTFHAIGYGKTTGFIEMFYQVEERFESFFDEDNMLPVFFSRNTRENKYRRSDQVTFRHKEKIAVSTRKVSQIPDNVQDIVSAFYFARCIDLTGVKPGKEFPVPFFLDDSVYNSSIRYVGRETIKIKLGKFNCLKIKPMVATGNVFENAYPMTIWVTDDKNRIPILIESELSVGSVRVEMTSYSGLNASVNIVPE